jgi:hypothetical protein
VALSLNYFGTTLAALAAEGFGITLDADSVPTLTNGQAAYKRRVGRVNAFVRSLNIEPDGLTDENSETFQIAALICEHLGKAYLYEATRPDDDGRAMAAHHLDQAAKLKDELRKRIREMGEEASSTAGKLQTSATTSRRNNRAKRMLKEDRLSRWINKGERP